MIITNPTAKKDRAGRVAEVDNADGLAIFRGLSKILEVYQPKATLVESPGGSKSVKAAAGIARAQQATADALYSYSGSTPIYKSFFAVKKSSVGKLKATKSEVEAFVRGRWPETDWDALLTTPPPYLEQGQRVPPPSKWENAFDAAAVVHAGWDHPTIAMLRLINDDKEEEAAS